MPAPDLETLLAFKENLEDSFKIYFDKAQFDAYTSRSEGTIKDNAVIVGVNILNATEHEATPATTRTGQPENDWFLASALIVVRTDRANQGAAESATLSNHTIKAAGLKKLMLRGSIAGTLNAAIKWESDYYDIVYLKYSGEGTDVDELGRDTTAITYDFQFKIRKAAWPA